MVLRSRVSRAAIGLLLPLALTALPAAAAPAAAPFTVHRVAEFDYPWRIAFLPDGRMLVTEKPGKLWLVDENGAKTAIAGVPRVDYQGQGGLLGVYRAPDFAQNHDIYLTYAEPGGLGSGLALAHATLDLAAHRLDDLRVIWRQLPRGKGGQFGGAVAFSPDGKFLFLSVGDRQRMTPAQNPSQPVGKILRLTLDGKPAPGNPWAGKTGAQTVPLIDPPRDTVAAKTAPVIARYTYNGPNLTPAETWASGFRTPYGLSFAPDGKLWELEHGPRGGDELNLIAVGGNYGWPLVSWGINYDGVPIPKPPTRPDLAAPVIQWTPVIGPGDLMFYSGQPVPRLARFGIRIGTGERGHPPDHVRRARRRARGRALPDGLPGPRRCAGARWRNLAARRRQSRRSLPPHAKVTAPAQDIIAMPPLTCSVCPVTYPASRLAR